MSLKELNYVLGSTTHVMRDMDSMDNLSERANSTVNGVEVLPCVKVHDIIKYNVTFVMIMMVKLQ